TTSRGRAQSTAIGRIRFQRHHEIFNWRSV
ncbi:hypothetical protein AK812_SmicGene47815, partial [Symbiodinium microadriaticum]